ncbi:hypothetical protein H072_908 [Dactylellina haptotyla CBS 200.50]|uniref:Uncharacterized protein n=1 Tax=Dactylellina haptotyla (strain CBS 200.50) TaxID=1284197 RepID=S8AQ81_DACHA|nr:hypothetical protein H072_908 [Dactylellina haptotyla CBS 200.50]
MSSEKQDNLSLTSAEERDLERDLFGEDPDSDEDAEAVQPAAPPSGLNASSGASQVSPEAQVWLSGLSSGVEKGESSTAASNSVPCDVQGPQLPRALLGSTLAEGSSTVKNSLLMAPSSTGNGLSVQTPQKVSTTLAPVPVASLAPAGPVVVVTGATASTSLAAALAVAKQSNAVAPATMMAPVQGANVASKDTNFAPASAGASSSSSVPLVAPIVQTIMGATTSAAPVLALAGQVPAASSAPVVGFAALVAAANANVGVFPASVGFVPVATAAVPASQHTIGFGSSQAVSPLVSIQAPNPPAPTVCDDMEGVLCYLPVAMEDVILHPNPRMEVRDYDGDVVMEDFPHPKRFRVLWSGRLDAVLGHRAFKHRKPIKFNIPQRALDLIDMDVIKRRRSS